MRPCIRHKYRLVANAYKQGQPSSDNFAGATWVAEKRCSVCGGEVPKGLVISK